MIIFLILGLGPGAAVLASNVRVGVVGSPVKAALDVHSRGANLTNPPIRSY